MSAMLSVSQLNAYVKSLLEGDFNLSNLYISGEISNFTNHFRTGHLYFSLKDSGAAVKAVMFRSAAQRLRFAPTDGMKVIVRCSVSLYERDGAFQLYVEDMQPDGLGSLNLAYEQLKRKLEAKGMFDESHKKSLPTYPEKIAVVTSPTGAAVRDILTVLERRFPLAQVVFSPVQVQGDMAAPQIIKAINKINEVYAADVIIVGRGGGSIEDLWAFNDEGVANAIYTSDIPVISAVGHETDYTIADFVADMRAPTPSAAAELAVPDFRSVLTYIDSCLVNGKSALYDSNDYYRRRVDKINSRLSQLRPDRYLKQLSVQLASLRMRNENAGRAAVNAQHKRLSVLSAQLEALSPLRVLSRGYAIALNESGSPLKSVNTLNEGDSVKIRLFDGSADCTVREINS